MNNLEKLYDSWYSNSYMHDWPSWKKKRVKKLIQSFHLPSKGIALDFGCGSGVFTNVLKEALPEWDVYGTDISEVAMKIGGERFPNVHFIKSSDCPFEYFDFVFTHHVLEHVEDIAATISCLNKYAKSNAKMLHILPCGNPGSLEYYLAYNTLNGVDENKGNTFFFEEEMHINRFTSEELDLRFKFYNWKLSSSFFANHHFAVFSWLAGMNTQFIKRTADPKNAIGKSNKIKFYILRFLLLLFYYLQRPYTYFKLRKLSKGWTGPLLRHPKLKPVSLYGSLEILIFPSFVFIIMLDFLERIDWLFFKKANDGAEMYLFFDRV